MDTEHDPPPHDKESDEPLGPMTPDEQSDLGDTTEVHGTISPHDVPKDSPNRREVEEQTEAEGGEATSGNA
ncbi:MAG TPA: hypothetical protein VFZ89_16590 [Solirubrobacteraceae bacterium]